MNLGYHEFIIGSDILLIKATFMGRKFVSHTQIYGVDLRILKRKSAWLTYLHIYVEWGPPTLASLRSQLVVNCDDSFRGRELSCKPNNQLPH